MKRFARVLPILLALVAFTQPAFTAEDPKKPEPKLCPFCVALAKRDLAYQDKVGNTLARGAMNFGFGWTEIITQPAQEARKGGNILFGMANGFSRSVGRTFGGLGEMLTFWTPKVDGQNYIHFNSDCPLDAPPQQ